MKYIFLWIVWLCVPVTSVWSQDDLSYEDIAIGFAQFKLSTEFIFDMFQGRHESCWTNYHFETPEKAVSNRNSFLFLMKYYQSNGPEDIRSMQYTGKEYKEEEGIKYRFYKFSYASEKADMISYCTVHVGFLPAATNKVYRISLQIKPRKK